MSHKAADLTFRPTVHKIMTACFPSLYPDNNWPTLAY